MNDVDLRKEIERLRKERDAYAQSLSLSNAAFLGKVQEFSIIKRIAETISRHMSKQKICCGLVDLIIDETMAENCSLWLLDHKTRLIRLVAVRGQSDPSPRFFHESDKESPSMEMGVGAAGWVAEHGSSLLIEDVNRSPHFIQINTEVSAKIRSLLCLPIKGRDGVIGILNLSHRHIGAFSRENERVLQLITDQAGIVLTNFFLFAQIQDLNRELEHKVEERTRNLRESEERFERAVRAGRVGIWDWEIGAQEIYVADNLHGMLSVNRESRSLKSWLKLIHKEGRKRLMDGLLKLASGKIEKYEGEHRMHRLTGGEFWFYIRAAAVKDGEGRPIRISGSNTDITERKHTEFELERAQQEALYHAHQAGKAEFATTVLHNIGNVLNSVNVSGNQIRQTLRKSKIPQMLMSLDLIRENLDNVHDFFAKHEKGKVLPSYLAQIGERLEEDYRFLMELSEGIKTKIDLMRDVIERQQSHAKGSDVIERRDLAHLAEEALKIQMESINKNRVSIRKRFHRYVEVELPTTQVIHILINLIKNAVEAMESTPEDKRVLYLDIDADSSGRPLLRIKDSGCGIEPSHLSNMFRHGFTTKQNGHGFGLHYCKDSMLEIGGDIQVRSEGVGKGASFELVFPVPAESDEGLELRAQD